MKREGDGERNSVYYLERGGRIKQQQQQKKKKNKKKKT